MNYLNSNASNIATSALKAIPFGDIIGGPLEACILAQEKAAVTTVNFIERVGMQRKPVFDATGNPVKIKNENGVEEQVFEWEAIYISFQFIQGGRMVRLNVPMLTVVPVPYIAINTIDINFKANISASAATFDEETESDSSNQKDSQFASASEYARQNTRKGVGFLGFYRKNNTSSSSSRNYSQSSMSASISSKKDSKGTAESKYSVEYTMDVAVHASQDSMPAGMAKILELIGTAMDLCDPDGEFVVNSTQFRVTGNEKVQLEASYKTPAGLLMAEGFKLYKYNDLKEFNKNEFNDKGLPKNGTELQDGRKLKDKKTYELGEGYYILQSDDKTQFLQLAVEKEATSQTT